MLKTSKLQNYYHRQENAHNGWDNLWKAYFKNGLRWTA